MTAFRSWKTGGGATSSSSLGARNSAFRTSRASSRSTPRGPPRRGGPTRPLDRRKVAALAGLAPVAKDSGLRENRRVIKGGRGQVRRALYMAAVASLCIKASPAKARYDQLIARGKAPKLALTALMRKMLVTLNAMLKTRQSWQSPT